MKKISVYLVLILMTLTSISIFGLPSNMEKQFYESGPNFIPIPGQDFMMLKTKVTREMYGEVMGGNPSEYKGNKNPVIYVSWKDAARFCNRLSEKYGLTPVYDETTWTWSRSNNANGFRLPNQDEWQAAADWGEKNGDLLEMGGPIKEWLFDDEYNNLTAKKEKRYAPGGKLGAGNYKNSTPDGEKPDVGFRIICNKQ